MYSDQTWIKLNHFPVEKLFLLLFYHLSIGLFKLLLLFGYPQLKFKSQTFTILFRKLVLFLFNLLENYLIQLVLKVVDMLVFDRQQFFQILYFIPQHINYFIFHKSLLVLLYLVVRATQSTIYVLAIQNLDKLLNNNLYIILAEFHPFNYLYSHTFIYLL